MIHLTDILIYLVLAFMSTCLIYFGRKKGAGLAVGVGLFIPIIYSAIRSYVGTDFGRYLIMYNEIKELSFGEFISSYTVEPVFFVLAKLSDLLFSSPILFFGIPSVLTVLFFYRGLLRYTSKPLYVSFAFLAFLLIVFPNTLNIVRQGVALSIVFYAFSYIPKRNFKRYLGYMIIATLFHYSTVVLLPIYLLGKIIPVKKSRSDESTQARLFVLFIASIAVFPVLLLILIPLLPQKYIELTAVDAGANLMFFFFMAIFLLLSSVFVLYKKKKDVMGMYSYFFFMLGVSFLFSGFFISETRRYALFFLPYLGLLIPFVIAMVQSRVAKRLLSIFSLIFIVGYFIMFYGVAGYGDIFPYQTILTRSYDDAR